MFGLFKKDKLNGFGLDISEASVKVVELAHTNSGLALQAFGKTNLSPKIITNHTIVDVPKLSSCIQKTILAAGKIDTPYVVVSIPEAKSFVRIIKLPKMDKSQIETAVPFEFEQNIPIPIDQVYFDWQIINEKPEELELLVTASPKDYIDSLIEVLTLSKLKPLAFEVESQATARALLDTEDNNQANLIIDISEVGTSFLLVEKNNLQYTSSIPVGGRSFTESIMRNFGLKAEEAEAIKREQGLVADTKKRNIRQAILPVLDNIVDEIKNVMRFYEEHYKNHLPLKQVILAGGASQLLGLSDYVAARLNLGSLVHVDKIVLGNPIRHLSTPPAANFNPLSFSTCVGLSMRGIDFKVDW